MDKLRLYLGGKEVRTLKKTSVLIKPICASTEITEKKYVEKFIEQVNSKPKPDAYKKNMDALKLFHQVSRG